MSVFLAITSDRDISTWFALEKFSFPPPERNQFDHATHTHALAVAVAVVVLRGVWYGIVSIVLIAESQNALGSVKGALMQVCTDMYVPYSTGFHHYLVLLFRRDRE